MESVGFPAMYLGSSAMFAGFSTGRPTALVIDMGAHASKICPVVDGFSVRKASVWTEKGGRYINNILKTRSENGILKPDDPSVRESGVVFTPQYEVLAKARGQSVLCNESYRNMHINDVVADLKKWICFIPYKPLPLDSRCSIISSLQIPPYELPDGTLVPHRDDLCTIGEEVWFAGSRVAPCSNPRKRSAVVAGLPAHAQPLFEDSTAHADEMFTDLVHQSLLKCDVDTRRELCANVVVCGGGSLMDGFIPRLTHEMTAVLSSSSKVSANSSLALIHYLNF